MKTYKIVRTWPKTNPTDTQVIAHGLSKAAAIAHCRDPKTHLIGEDGFVEWFDGFEEDQ